MGRLLTEAEELAPGAVLLDKYTIEAQLGRGGMGTVVRAHHTELDDRVAIKVLRTDAADDPESTVRFVREARATAKLRSAHVTRVTDVGTMPNGKPYMVMELLEGLDVAKLVETRAFAERDATDLVLQACEALAEAHSLGIVHRDIKPSNLFVVELGGKSHVKVLDFGIAKSQGVDLDTLTQTASMLGTPSYMSPEQMRSAHAVDARSDMWSLGVVLYEMIEGRRPFAAANFTEVLLKVSTEPPDPPAAMSPGLWQVVARCLAKKPDDRYQSMGDLAAALLPFAGDRAAGKRLVEGMAFLHVRTPPYGTARPSASPTHAIEADHSGDDHSTVRDGARKKRIALVAIAGVAIVGAVVLVLKLRRGVDADAPNVSVPDRELPTVTPSPTTTTTTEMAPVAPVIDPKPGSAKPRAGSAKGSAAPVRPACDPNDPFASRQGC